MERASESHALCMGSGGSPSVLSWSSTDMHVRGSFGAPCYICHEGVESVVRRGRVAYIRLFGSLGSLVTVASVVLWFLLFSLQL